MRSTHLEAIPASVQWPPSATAPGRAGVPCLNKFENVSSDHHQMSLGWGSPGLMCRGIPHLACPGDTLPCDLSDDAFDVTYPLVNSQTNVKTLTWSVSLFINEWHRFQTHWVSYLIGFVEFVSYLLSLLPDQYESLDHIILRKRNNKLKCLSVERGRKGSKIMTRVNGQSKRSFPRDSYFLGVNYRLKFHKRRPLFWIKGQQ